MRRDGPPAALPRPAAVWAAGLSLGALYAFAALAAPIGNVGDDATHIMLARSLSRGAFALPDAHGAAVNDPLPGFAALLCLPARLVEPHWALLKIIGPLCALLALALAWRLARRFLSGGEAIVATALTALNPLWVSRSGLILPDLPYLALSLFLVDAMPAAGASSAATAWLAAAAAAASLLRPEGLLLVLSLGLGIAAQRGWRKGCAFLAPAFAPLALWTLRNRLLTPAGSGYVVNLGSQAAALADPRAAAAHAMGLLASLGGKGLFAAGGLPEFALAALGLAAAAMAAAGTLRLLRRGGDPRVFAIACYGLLWMVQHLVWSPVAPRYMLPLIPFAWILILAGVRPPLERSKPAGLLVLSAFAAAMLGQDFAAAAPGLRGDRSFMPETMAWIRENTSAQARIESIEATPVTLFSGRPATLPPATDYRDAWLAWALRQKIGYVLLDSSFQPDGYFPPSARMTLLHLEQWAHSTPYARDVYRNDGEGAVVVRLEHPDPARYLEAWDAFQAAGAAARAGKPPAQIRAALERALKLEPRLAVAWAALAGLTNDAREKRRLLQKAADLDPTSAPIRSDLDQAGRPSPR